MDASRFDDTVRAFVADSSRRSLFGLAIAGGLTLAWPSAGRARKPRKKKCGICEKRKRGKCKPKPNDTVCGEGKVCRNGRCECQQPCGNGLECFANGSCARRCPASFDCGAGCGCGLPSAEGPQYCAFNEGGCEEFTQGCESTADCPIGLYCVPSNCALPPRNRCFPLRPV